MYILHATIRTWINKWSTEQEKRVKGISVCSVTTVDRERFTQSAPSDLRFVVTEREGRGRTSYGSLLELTNRSTLLRNEIVYLLKADTRTACTWFMIASIWSHIHMHSYPYIHIHPYIYTYYSCISQHMHTRETDCYTTYAHAYTYTYACTHFV